MDKIDYDPTVGIIISIIMGYTKGKSLDRIIESFSYVLSNRIKLIGVDRFTGELGTVLHKYVNSEDKFSDGKVKRIVSRTLRDGIGLANEKQEYLDIMRQVLYA